MGKIIKKGKEVLPYMADIYQQLYVAPGKEGAELYPLIVQKGEDAPKKDLSHFQMDEEDRLELVDTPAGNVQVVTLHVRADFECFLEIMGNKCIPYEVPATQGASILDGVVNWQKIKEHQKVWMEGKQDTGMLFLDWPEEFRRFTSEKSNYRDVLIILSTGPYSNIPAASVGMEEQEWLKCSYIIRKFHECTHFVCRRKFPEQIDAVWDEIVADATGIIAALDRYDPAMEEVFFGIRGDKYIGGRLENYVDKSEDLDIMAEKVHNIIKKIRGLYETHCENNSLNSPFDFAVLLEEKQQEWWSETVR